MIDPERVGVAGFSADGYTADPRVRAAFVMALFDVPFGKAGLSQVRRPVYSPCSQKLAEQAPELCKDPSGVDRRERRLLRSCCSSNVDSAMAERTPG